MSNKQILLLAALVLAYYAWHWQQFKKNSVNLKTGRRGSWTTTPNAFGSGASTTPTTSSLTVGVANPKAGRGRGFVASPVQSIAALNASPGSTRNLGTASPSTIRSARRYGASTFGVAASWATSQVTSAGQVKTGSGAVQVPSYTAIPVVTQGPGGGGSILSLAATQ